MLSFTDSPSFRFGTVTVGTTSNHSLTLTNTGNAVANSISAAALSAPFQYLGGTYPGTGGTCSSSLSALASCTLTVEFIPSAASAYSDSLTLSYNNGVSSTSSSLTLTGTGSSASLANLSISDGPTFDYGTISIGSLANHTFTVTNSGSGNATSLNSTSLTSPFTFSGGSYPGSSGTCGTTLNAAASCTIEVQFQPTSAGVYTDTIAIDYNDGSSSQQASRNISATSVTPALLTISESNPYDFGNVTTGSSLQHSFTITNTGGATATTLVGSGLAAPFSFYGGVYPGTGGTCAASLAAGNSCTILINFSPSSVSVSNDSITIDYNDGVMAQQASRDITGTGNSPSLASLTLSDGPTYDFGSVTIGASVSHVFTVSNTGSGIATSLTSTLSSPFNYSGGSFPGISGTCGASLAASSTCTIEVQYQPVALGIQTDTLTLNYNDGSTAQQASRNISGTSVSPALLVISESNPYDFGSLSTGSSSQHSFTVTNSGGSTATSLMGSGLAAPFNFYGGAYPGTGGTCAVTLSAGATCTIMVDFSPVTTGVNSDSITLDYNDGVNLQQATRDIQGTGI